MAALDLSEGNAGFSASAGRGSLLGSEVSMLMILLFLISYRRGSQGKFDPENAALSWRAQGFNASMVGDANRSDNRKAKTRPTQIATSGIVHPEKSFEDVRQRLGWNADAIIDYLQERLAFLSLDHQINHSARWCVLDCIIQQVHYDLLDSGTVPLDPDILCRGTVDLYVLILAQQRHLIRR